LTIVYKKAIRDKIPEIIKDSGKECKILTLSDEEFLIELEKKIQEEYEEYLESKSIEELADIWEIIMKIIELKQSSLDELNLIRLTKKQKRGGFEKNLFLINTY